VEAVSNSEYNCVISGVSRAACNFDFKYLIDQNLGMSLMFRDAFALIRTFKEGDICDRK